MDTTPDPKRPRSTPFLLAVAAIFALMAALAIPAGAIVNGTASSAGKRPYQVSLQSGGEHFCGGTIIDATTIVTAAHCLEGENAEDMTIRAGVTDRESTDGQDRAVVGLIPHPEYGADFVDIAVLKLAEPLILNDNVQAIPLATQAQIDAAGVATVSGWGAVSENGADSRQLLEANVPVVADATCAASLDGVSPSNEVCAGGTGTDSCYGDSGGPLVVETQSGLALGGVVSWGDECGGATPGVYADVPALTNWITSAQAGEVAAVTSVPVSSFTGGDGVDIDFGDIDFDDDNLDIFEDDATYEYEGDFDEDDFDTWFDSIFGDLDYELLDDEDLTDEELDELYDWTDEDPYYDDIDWTDDEDLTDEELDELDDWTDEDLYYDDTDWADDEDEDFWLD